MSLTAEQVGLIEGAARENPIIFGLRLIKVGRGKTQPDALAAYYDKAEKYGQTDIAGIIVYIENLGIRIPENEMRHEVLKQIARIVVPILVQSWRTSF